MLKMLKYEYRRSLSGLLVMIGILCADELFLLISAWGTHKEGHFAAGYTLMMLGAFASYWYVLLSGVVEYSKDLKQKQGYLVFMTPVSAYKIIGAKLLSTLISGVILLATVMFFLTTGYVVGTGAFGLSSMMDVIDFFLSTSGTTMAKMIAELLVVCFVFVVFFFTIVSMAYLSVSLSATVLQNKKTRTLISIVFFVVLSIFIGLVGNFLPDFDFDLNSEFWSSMLNSIPTLIWFIIVIEGCHFGSAYLLEKKISL